MNNNGRASNNRRGIALIIALGLLALVAVMFLGYTASMKSQRFQAKNYNDAVQARILAMSAVDRAMALIGSNTPVRSPTTNTWYSGPGLINKYTGTVTPLYQDTATSPATGPLLSAGGGVPTGLNQQTTSGDYDIVPNIGTTTSIYKDAKLDVNWINVGKNPSSAIAANTNPLAARYAFWVDDEATKVNLNYANLQTALNPAAYSTRKIDLTALYDDAATPGNWSVGIVNDVCNALYNLACVSNSPAAASPLNPDKPFETFQELRRVSSIGTTAKFDRNKFFTTAYSWDDNKTFAGALRRDITITNPTTGLTVARDITDKTSTNSLYGLMAASPWTLIFRDGHGQVDGNFETVYGVNGLKQIIANIIDYQKDDTLNSTYNDPMDVSMTFGGKPRGTPNDGGWLGLRKSPYINEVLVDMKWTQDSPPTNPVTIYLTIRVRVELINPFSGVNLPATPYLLTAQLYNNPVITFQFSPNWSTPPSFSGVARQTVAVPANDIPANSYKVYEMLFYTTTGKMPQFSMPQSAIATVQLDDVRLLASTTDSFTDIAKIRDYGPLVPPFPVLSLPQQSWSYAVPALSFQRNDPRVRTYNSGLTSTPGILNNGVTGFNTSATGTKTVNSDTGGIGPTPPKALQTDFMGPSTFDPKDIGNPSPTSPTPPGDPSWIAAAPMQSIGELGRIHTGYQWRTLRLQPRPSVEVDYNSSLNIPDWAILDLVRIPAIENVRDDTSTPQTDSRFHQVKGRININQQINAASVSTGGSLSNFRERPLYALLKGWANTSNISTIVDDIYKVNLYNVNVLGSPPFGGAGYDTIGEICEVLSMQYGVSSAGSPGNDAQQEEIIRNIANLITTRSNVFTVWAVAQTVQDVNKNGTFEASTDIITAEQKIMAVIERYEDTAGKVRFRIKYLKYLTE